MKFNGNPVDLGLSYHTFTEVKNGDGTTTVRYVLTEKLSPADKEELRKYENVKFIEKGAKYKYDPNITYDTLYITIPNREIATEDFEDEHLGNSDYSLMDSKRFSDEDDSMEILAQLDEEVNAPITSEIDSNAKYSYLAQGINIENESIVYYDQLMTMFPEWTPVLQDIKKEELKHIGQLQTLLNQNPEVAQNFQEGIVEGEKQIVGNSMADSATEAIKSSNLKNFVDEARAVSDWYFTFAEEGAKVEGPGSIIGLDFWDGGDHIDYINSAILGFDEYSYLTKNREDYIKNFFDNGFITPDSSEEWKKKIYHLANLYGKLTKEEILQLPKEFSEYDLEWDGWDEDKSDFEELADNFWDGSGLGSNPSINEVTEYSKDFLESYDGSYGKYTDYRELAKDMLKYHLSGSATESVEEDEDFEELAENFWDGSGLGANPKIKDVEEYSKYFLETYDGRYGKYTDYKKLAKDMLKYSLSDSAIESVNEDFEDDEYDEEKMGALEEIVVKKIQNNRKFDDETKEELIEDIRAEGLVEFMGFELYENGDWVKNPEMAHVLDSEEKMIKAANKYIRQLEKSLSE